MIGITGRRSTIAQEFVDICGDMVSYGTLYDLPYYLDKYLICHGVMHGKSARQMEDSEAIETIVVNFSAIVKFLDKLFDINPHAKVCVLGSESGNKGSYDTIYAGSKAAMHLYVETKQLEYPGQHLVCVAPTIVSDSGMTKRRIDLDATIERGKQRRIGRWLNAHEVAEVCNFSLDQPGLCNTVIRMNGGW